MPKKKSDKSQFEASFEAQLAESEKAQCTVKLASDWMGEVLEWSMYFVADSWDPAKGKCLPIDTYHADYLENMRKCCMLEGYSKDEVAMWIEVVMRGGIKTTLTRIIMLWVMTELVKSQRYEPKGNLEEDMIYITGTEPKARKKMTWIWHQLRHNRLIKSHYGTLLPRKADPETSSSVEAQLNNGFWIAAFGIKGGIRSSHPRFLVIDDPEELAEGNEKKVTENTWDVWASTIDGMMGPGTSCIYTANYVGLRCLTRKLTKIHPDRFKERPGWTYKPDGTKVSLWPQKFTIPFLEQKEKTMGEGPFRCEILLDPVADSGSPIKEEWIQMYDSEDKSLFPGYWWARCPIVIFFDPAYTDRDDSDYTAIVTICMDVRDPRVLPGFYCLDARRGRWTDHEEILEKVRELYWQYRKAIGTGVEVYVENAIQVEAKGFIATNRLMNEKRSDSMPLRDWIVREDGRSKKARISKTAHYYREHRMHFDIRDMNQQTLIDELVLFGDEDHDDYADACTGALNVYRKKEDRIMRRLQGATSRLVKTVRDPVSGRLRERLVAR